jgi:sensor histidine kinase YesM
MLLIIFVENAFKHAKNTIGHKIAIDIKLSVSNGHILFFAGNSCQDQSEENSLIRERPGLGINNAIKRLELVYGSEGYSLEQHKECHYYTVELTIKTR